MVVERKTAMKQEKKDHRLFELESFINSRKILKLSTDTIEWYEEKLGKFFKYLDNISFQGSIEDITPAVINTYLGKIGQTSSAGNVHHHYRTLKTFLFWYDRELQPDWCNPITRVQPPKIVVNPLPGIKRKEFEKLLEACGSGFYGKRDRAIIRALFDTGVRRSEFLRMNVGDIEFDDGTVIIYKSKTHKRRPVFLAPEGKRDVMRYIRELPQQKSSSPLWVTKTGSRLTKSGLRQIVRRLADRAGIETPGFHDFRRAFALQSKRNGMSDTDLVKILGNSTAVLNRYLDTDDDDLRKAHENSRSDW